MKQTMTCAEILGSCLKREGVEFVFGLPGHGNIAMLDGIIKEKIPFKMLHHETIAGFAADGYYRATGKPGVVCLTCSPGAFNTMLSVTTSAMDCSAIVYIVGDTPQQFAGKTSYEEFDLHGPDEQFEILRPMFKRAWKISRVDLLPEVIGQAFNVALSGKPGPVLIDIPFDLQKVKAEVDLIDTTKRRATHQPVADEKGVEEVLSLIESAKTLVLFYGGGARLARAGKELVEFAERTGAIVVSSMAGFGVFPTDHPNFAGIIGSYGIKAANEICRNADLIIAIGTKFEESETSVWMPEYVFNPEKSRFIQIDIDSREIGKNYPVEIGLVGDAKGVLQQLITKMKGKEIHLMEKRKILIQSLQDARKDWLQSIKPSFSSDEIPLNPRRVLYELEQRLPANASITCDPSWARLGMMQQSRFHFQEEVFIVCGLIPIGWSCSSAIGVQLASPDRKIISLNGDGGFLLNSSVVASAVEHGLNIIWVILNNLGYNSLGVLSTVYFGESQGSWFVKEATKEPYSPDYALLAKAFGADGEMIVKPEHIGPAIDRAFSSNKPYVLDFRISGPASRLVRTAEVTWDYFWERLPK